MQYFDQNFKTQLRDTIAEIENNSLVEIVTVVKARSHNYADVPLWWGVICWFSAFTFFMFHHKEYGDYTFYTGTIIGFIVGMILPLSIKSLMRLFISKTKLKKQVELKARAIFQKAGIRHTKDEIGVLFYISLFEKEVFILPDRGAENSLPEEEWELMHKKFQTIFAAPNPASALLKALKNTVPVFSAYIPPIENDINELPDEVEINL
ncbi:MAG: TPM domain-containing protein [Flammeovirgaceae bacterium]